MPEPTPEKRPVPDLDMIEVGGQRLTRVKRRTRPEHPGIAETDPEEARAPIASLEELARKHLGPDPASALEAHGEFLRALSEPPGEDETLPIADLAGRMELFSDMGAVPHPETNPLKREDGALSPIIATDDAPDFLAGHSHPETIFDLFQLFPQLDGVNWWIYVTRKTPALYSGINVAGTLRPITRTLSLSDWQEIYGGGTYELIVYGPPKTGIVLDATGRVPVKKLTQPITFKFPGIPSLESMVYDDEGSAMSQQVHEVLTNSRRPLSIGESKVAEKQVEVAENREIRQETETKEARREAQLAREREAKQQEGLLGKLLDLQREGAARESEIRGEMLERERQFAEQRRLDDEKWEARLQHLTGEKKPDDVERLIKLSASMNTGGDTDALRAAHAQEVKQLTEQRAKDAERHDQLLKDERARADAAIRDATERADRRIKDAEERFHNNERDARERAATEVQRAKDDAERRVGDQHRQNETRIADLDRAHTRDLESLKMTHAMALDSLKNSFEMRTETLRGDAKRAQSDADRARTELEDHKDLPKQIGKLKKAAEELGMTDASDIEPPEPETVGQTLLKVAGNLAGSLPQVVESIGGLLGKRTDQEIQAARMQGRQDMIEQAGGFAGGGYAPAGQVAGSVPPPRRPRRLQPIESAAPPPLVPGHEPFRPQQTRSAAPRPIPGGDDQPEEQLRQEFLARAAAAAEQQQHQQEFVPAIPGPGVDPFHTGMPPEPMMAQPAPPPAQAASIPPPPPALAAAPPQDAAQAAEDAQLLQAEPLLRAPFESGESPENVARGIAQSYPKETIAQLLASLGSAQRVLDAFARQRPPEHPFNRYAGKKFIRGLFEELGKVVRG